jgi:hypothetical protein
VVLNSIGKPEVDVYFGVFRTTLTVVAILVGAEYGVEVVAWALLVSKCISFIIILLVINYQIPYKFNLFFNSLGNALLVLISLNLIAHFIKPFSLNAWLDMAISVSVAILMSIGLNYALIKDIARIILSNTGSTNPNEAKDSSI